MLDFNIGWENFANSEHNVLFVCAMGIGTVFVGLILLIFVCRLIGVFTAGKSETKEEPVKQPVTVASVAAQPIENKQELIAAISAAVAEELGTDVTGIRILSIKKL